MGQRLLDNSNPPAGAQAVRSDLAIRSDEVTRLSLAAHPEHQGLHREGLCGGEYVCPGEVHSISYSIHLARLASNYSKCGECDHRHDTGSRRLATEDLSRETGCSRVARQSLLVTDGVRGIYLNELDRTRAAQWGAALAAMLWEDEPRRGRARRDDGDAHDDASSERSVRAEEIDGGGVSRDVSELGSNELLSVTPATRAATLRRGPVVVIGFDERSSSPDIVTGVALGLRRMGCQVIDLGQVTAPCFQFAVRQLDAAAGMFVTGSGCEPAWTGLDVVGRHARPWSKGHQLDELEQRAKAEVLRPTRSAGSQRTLQAVTPYEAELAKHFHALRPLHVVCGAATRLFPRTLDRLFAKLPCRVTHVSLPLRQRDLADPNDADVRRVAAAVTSGGQHMGLIVDDDGQHCAFVTERGRLVTAGELARVLIEFERREQSELKIVFDRSLSDELTGWLTPRRVAYSESDATAAGVVETLARVDSRLGLLGNSPPEVGRVWFRETHAICDAILTLARTLQALSLSDASFSEIVCAASMDSFVA